MDDFIREHVEQFTPNMPGTVPLILTALGHEAWKMCYVPQLDLSRFPKLPGHMVVKLVQAVVDGSRSLLTRKRKRDARELDPLKLLDVSLNDTVTPDRMTRILDMTRLDELCIWDNWIVQLITTYHSFLNMTTHSMS